MELSNIFVERLKQRKQTEEEEQKTSRPRFQRFDTVNKHIHCQSVYVRICYYVLFWLYALNYVLNMRLLFLQMRNFYIERNKCCNQARHEIRRFSCFFFGVGRVIICNWSKIEIIVKWYLKKKKNGGKYGITNNNSMLIIEMMKVPKKKIPLFNKRKTLARFARWFLIQFQKIDFWCCCCFSYSIFFHNLKLIRIKCWRK